MLSLLRMSPTQLETVLHLAQSRGLFTAAGNRSEAWFRRPRAIFHRSCDSITDFLDVVVGISKPSRPAPFVYGFLTSKAHESVAFSSKNPERNVTTLQRAFLLENLRIAPVSWQAESDAFAIVRVYVVASFSVHQDSARPQPRSLLGGSARPALLPEMQQGAFDISTTFRAQQTIPKNNSFCQHRQ